MIILDTSVLVGALTGSAPLAPALVAAIERGERMALPSLVLYEWLRGPRTEPELAFQERLFPAQRALVFGPAEAEEGARLYRLLKRPRGREIDLGIAACALLRNGELWTANPVDFADIPGLRLKKLSLSQSPQ